MHTSKKQFLRANNNYGYGCDGVTPESEAEAGRRCRVDSMRRNDFPQLQDHAGATLYAKSQLQHSFKEMETGLFGNPHSHASLHTQNSSANRVAAMRRRILAFFNASEEEYAVVFTSGATAAVKIVGECFPWSEKSHFAHSMDSHTSVLGLRGHANLHNARIHNVVLDEMKRMEAQAARRDLSHDVSTPPLSDGPFHLFAFPAECNFSGSQHTLDLVSHIQGHGFANSGGQWLVLLDAAKYVATHPLDLRASQPDFIALSFYKLFGYPTGIGALLVHKKRALPLLHKMYYGGGTVANILASSNFVRLRDKTDAARLEDGTVSYLSIVSLRHGFDLLEDLTMAAVEQHTTGLARLLRSELQSLTHWNGASAAEIYGQDHGNYSIVSFNFRRVDESYVGYAEVGKLAAIHNIHLRTGCFCNPGACQWYLGLKESDLLAGMAAGHVCGDDVDIVNGQPTGAVRVSVGYMSTYEDVGAFIAFASKYFVALSPPPSPVGARGSIPENAVVLRKIMLFPIKSCAGMSVDAWPLGSRGLLYDREWAVLDASTRKALTLKDAPEMCFLDPLIDLKSQTLTIHCRKQNESFTLPLSSTLTFSQKDEDAQDMRVCAAPCKGRDVGDDASQWLSRRLQRACRLVRVVADSARSASSPRIAPPSHPDAKIGFANQAQFLLISRASVANLNESLEAAGADMQIREDAFRANLIVDSASHVAFAEDAWTTLRMGDVAFDVTGPCSRCSMVNIDPVTGAFHRAPLQVLSRYRRERSHIFFGQFLVLQPEPPSPTIASDHASTCTRRSSVAWLRCGTPVDVEVRRDLL